MSVEANVTIFSCPGCGARYRVPAHLLGKRGKCKKCEARFVYPAAVRTPVMEAPNDDLLGELARGTAQERAASPTVSEVYFGASGLTPLSDGGDAARDEGGGGMLPFLRDVGRSLWVFRSMGDAVTFGLAVFILSLQLVLRFGGFFGTLGSIVIAGWYMAFQLNIVKSAAGGEQDLPDLAAGGWSEGVLVPLLCMLAAWLTALTPFLVCLVYFVAFGQIGGYEAGELLGRAVVLDVAAAFDPNTGGNALLGGILLFSYALWPILLLVVAVGGLPGLIRLDLVILTIVKSIDGYVLVVILTYVAILGAALLAGAVADSGGPAGRLGLGYNGLMVGVYGLSVYATIFAMRVIGLYYHHFKQRFAWSWG